MAAINPCLYDQIEISAESTSGKPESVDIRLGVISLRIYEDIFSPTLTAQVFMAVAGEVINGEGLYNGLPVRGGERVSIKIAGNSEGNKGFDFTTPDTYWYVSAVNNYIKQGNKEIFVMELVSREAVTNETTHLVKKYATDSKISDVAKDILENKLKTRKPTDIDDTSNSYGFIGNLKKPFHTLVWLASKSSPTNNKRLAGFLFFETIKGYKFKGIDNLIKDGKKNATKYIYREDKETDRPSDRDILQYSISQNTNLLKEMMRGKYSTFHMEFNPLDGRFTTVQNATFKLEDVQKKVESLGEPVEIPQLLSDPGVVSVSDMPSRIMTSVSDVGVLSKKASNQISSESQSNHPETVLRYNLLFTQVMSMIIPLNTEISAGDVIQCEFIGDNHAPNIGGYYLIKEICHHMDGQRSVSSLKLVRDTYGEIVDNG